MSASDEPEKKVVSLASRKEFDQAQFYLLGRVKDVQRNASVNGPGFGKLLRLQTQAGDVFAFLSAYNEQYGEPRAPDVYEGVLVAVRGVKTETRKTDGVTIYIADNVTEVTAGAKVEPTGKVKIYTPPPNDYESWKPD